MSYEVNGEEVDEYGDFRDLTSGTLNCSVLTRPQVELSMYQGEKVLENDTQCYNYNAYDYMCYVTAIGYNPSKGFHCDVKYISPEHGDLVSVEPSGCCEKSLYPATESVTPVWNFTENPGAQGAGAKCK